MEENTTFAVEAPEKKPGGGKKILKLCLAVILLILAALLAVFGIGELTGEETQEEPAFFDPSSDSQAQQYLEFNMLTDPVATFTLGENHSVYIAFYVDDTGLYPYLVCLSQEEFEKHRDIYEFTFNDQDISEAPGFASVRGYAEEIGDDLRDYTIEYFNYFMDTDLLDESNFYDYLGRYYLDTTAVSKADHDDAIAQLIIAGVLAVFAVCLLLPARKKRDTAAASASDGAVPSNEDAPAWEIQSTGNPIMGAVGAVLGSLVGAVVWVLLYKLGYIAGIAGYLAVVCSIWCYKKLGGGIGKLGTVLCVVISIAVMVLANGVAYAWVVAGVVNEANPGRSSIGYILANFGPTMEMLDLWGSFVGDLALGLLLALVASISPLIAAFKGRSKNG